MEYIWKGMESTWNPCGKLWIPWWNDVESCGIHVELCGIHVESCGFHGGMMWNDVESYGIHVELCGIHVESCGFHGEMKWNPCGNVWNPWSNVWNPCGDLWNRTIPPGIHLECGGRVNYCILDQSA